MAVALVVGACSPARTTLARLATDQNRVLLVPADVAKGFVGSRVEVTGMFEFDAARGRLLWVEAIAPPPDG